MQVKLLVPNHMQLKINHAHLNIPLAMLRAGILKHQEVGYFLFKKK